MKSRTHRRFTAWTAAVLLLLPLSAQATSRLLLTLDELVGGSELVFTGTVIDVSVATEGELVYSTVRFEVEDLVKGEAGGATLELRFLGGLSAEQRTEVAGQYIPAVGAHGLWFVDDTVRNLVNPLTGWSQGYFPLVTAADGSLWLDLQEHPDYEQLQQDAAPLAGKMRDLNFTREQIAERFPERLRYPLNDFVAVIRAVAAERGE